ncbi:MAG: hypothetical protein LBD11_06765 [Candidatus Peribacteria bacterium]|jgi:hypothetical protein|nr:hypothetical protein [Candidatus Peribacteria bacterium]
MIHTLKTYFKKGLYGLLVLVMGNLFLFGNIGGTPTQITSAQGRESVQATQQQKTDEKLLEFREKAEVITRLAYFILWPVLVIAGWAMDNSMVYGEIFGFDSVLRTVRNLTKNIANFAL